MFKLTRRAALAGTIATFVGGLDAQAQTAPLRIAFGDIASVESLNFLIAIERAKEKGVAIEVTFFKEEDIAAQAVVSGEADVGVGTPYALLQKVQGADPHVLPAQHAALLSDRRTSSSTRTGRISTGRRWRCIRAAPAPRRS